MLNTATKRKIQDNTIDFLKLIETVVKHKLMILIITVLTTLSAWIYVSKSPPVYCGNVEIEVGEVINYNQNKQNTILYLDDVNNLKEITARMTGLTVDIPANTNNILNITYENSDPLAIKPKIQQAIDFIMKRHQQKADLYKMPNTKIRMTQLVGNISLGDQPIKPKKKLIVLLGLISGLILGIFSVFMLEFFKTAYPDMEEQSE